MNIARNVKYVVIIIVILLAIISLTQGIRNALRVNFGSFDFQWDAAWFLLNRQNPYTICLSGQHTWTEQYVGRLWPNQFPSCLILLWPYAVFEWPVAKILWLVSNLLFTGVILYIAFKQFLPDRSRLTYLIIASIFIAGTPWRNLIGNGQHALFSMAFFLIALWYAYREKTIVSGVCLAISLFKYTLIGPLWLFFLYKRQYKILGIAVGIHTLLHFFSSFWLWESPLKLIRQPLLVSAVLSQKGYLDLTALFSNLTSPLAAYMLGGLLLTVTCYIIYHNKTSDLLVLSALSFVSTVIIYHRGYDYVILLFPLLLIAATPVKSWKTLPLIFCSASIVCTWFIDKLMLVITPIMESHGVLWIRSLYFVTLVVVWYFTIILLLRSIKQSNQQKGMISSSSVSYPYGDLDDTTRPCQ